MPPGRRPAARARSASSAAPARAACRPHASGSLLAWRGRRMCPCADMPSTRPPIGASTPAVQPTGWGGLPSPRLAALLGACWTAATHAVDPLNTMRAYCQADGRGERLDPRTWPRVADLVTWPLEPAWDHLYLIRGFEIGAPQLRDGDVQVDVQYVISGEVRSSVVKEVERVETR